MGYTGGSNPKPSYRSVCAGKSAGSSGMGEVFVFSFAGFGEGRVYWMGLKGSLVSWVFLWLLFGFPLVLVELISS